MIAADILRDGSGCLGRRFGSRRKNCFCSSHGWGLDDGGIPMCEDVKRRKSYGR
jgi:hypothetical protein